DDARGDVVDLRVGERAFAALERKFYEQRVLSGWHIFATEQVGGFDGSDFGNVEGRDGFGNVGKARRVGEQQGEIAFDGGKTRNGLVAAGIFDAVVRAIKRAEVHFGEENVLAEFQALGDAAGKLAGDAQ